MAKTKGQKAIERENARMMRERKKQIEQANRMLIPVPKVTQQSLGLVSFDPTGAFRFADGRWMKCYKVERISMSEEISFAELVTKLHSEIRLTKKLGLVSIPGALTPSECKTAYKNGADIIKLFPATVDKIDYIINITRPLSHIPFICTGGTNENTIEAFIKAGATGVGTGLSILKPELIESENYAEITRLARLHVDRIKEARA